MGRRGYRRNRRGQFASSGGTMTYGNAGGFANAAHRSAVQGQRVRRARRRRVLRIAVKAGGAVAAVGLASALGSQRRNDLALARFVNNHP